jgi:HEAT repeat protein
MTVPEVAAASGEGVDRVSLAPVTPSSGEHFPDTPVGRALDKHLLILVDINPGADDRKQRSLEDLRRHAKEASQALLDAYHGADPADSFGRWLISLTLGELKTNEGYPGLREIATSANPAGLKDSDREGSALTNESAIRQNAAGGLAGLARAGNTEAEKDLLSLALSPPSGDDAVRTVAIKGYLAAGTDYEARVQTLMAQLPRRYHDVVTLTVSQPEPAAPPDRLPASPKNGG